MNQHRILFGGQSPLPEIRNLRAGNLSVVYENGFLRYVRLGKAEVLRMINHTVRDQNWNTMSFSIIDEKIDQRQDSFHIHYIADINEPPVLMRWDCTIIGKADGRIEFEIKGEVGNQFRRNRAGFTVLHPIKECKGKSVWITHLDGRQEEQFFPTLISPHQPFKDIKTMKWQLANQGTATLAFEGDVFETEDQRNWIDDSYKTYCTPLERPFPVTLEKGDVIHQKIVLAVDGDVVRTDIREAGIIVYKLTENVYPLPRLGVSKASGSTIMMGDDFKKIEELRFDHYRCEIRFSDPSWEDYLEESCREANTLSIPLELVLIFPDATATTDMLTNLLEKTTVPIDSITLLGESTKVTPEFLLATAGPFLRTMAKARKVGAGTNAFFTELNRNRITSPAVDYLSWSVNPQVHASDHRTLVENLQALSYTVETARHFGQEKLLYVSPVTFKMRWNPNATKKNHSTDEKDTISNDADSRQASLFGAAWGLGCIKYLSESGSDWITLFETVGSKGLARGSSAGTFWDGFDLAPEDVYPLWHALHWITEFKEGEVVEMTSAEPLQTDGMALRKDGRLRVVIMNYTSEKKIVSLDKSLNLNQIRILDEDNYHQSCANTAFFHHHEKKIEDLNRIELPPFALACLDEQG